MVIPELKTRRDAIIDPTTEQPLSQRRLAELAGVTEKTIQKAENGRGVHRATKVVIDAALAKLERAQKKQEGGKQ